MTQEYNNKSSIYSTIANFFTIVSFILVIFTNILVVSTNRFSTAVQANMTLLQEQIRTIEDLSNLIIDLEISLLLYKKLKNEENRERVYESLIRVNAKSQKLSAISPSIIRKVSQKIYLESLELNINTIDNIKKLYIELSNNFNLSYLKQKK